MKIIDNLKLGGMLTACLLIQGIPFQTSAQGNVEAERIIYYECDFNNGMPDDIKLYDRDNAQLAVSCVQLGFSSTASWAALSIFGSDMHAASSSLFKKIPGQNTVAADDWMVLPPIWVRGSDAVLRWKGQSVNQVSYDPSSYKVLVSTKGSSPKDFEDAVTVADIAEETLDEWERHEVSLSQWEGQTIYVAFVNNSFDKEILAIDDIVIEGRQGMAAVEYIPGQYSLGDTNIRLQGKIKSCTDQTLSTLDVTWRARGNTYTKSFTGLDIKPGETFDFDMDASITAEYGQTIDMEATATVNGIEIGTSKWITEVLCFLPQKRIVVEESTGMWCGHCPKGIVALDTLHMRYPDSFIGIALHIGDVLEVPEWHNGVTFPKGSPSAWINRDRYLTDMLSSWRPGLTYFYSTLDGGIETFYIEELKRTALAEIKINAKPDGNNFNFEARMRFPVNITEADYRVAVAVIEDHVWKEGYYQTNYISGKSESLSGFESLPPMITSDFEFNHVARAIYDGWQGIDRSVPSSLTAGEEYTYSGTFKIPECLNRENVKIVGMIIDSNTGRILNADIVNLITTSIDDIACDDIAVRYADNTIVIETSGNITARLTDLSGRTVVSAAGNGTATVDTSSLKGIYILSITTEKSVISKKISL